MYSKNLLTTTAVLLMLVAIAWSATPGILYPFFNITLNDDLRFMAWRYAAYIIGLAVTLWLARGVADTGARRAILTGAFITIALTCALSLYAALIRSPLAWIIGGSEVLLVAWFAYVLFVAPKDT